MVAARGVGTGVGGDLIGGVTDIGGDDRIAVGPHIRNKDRVQVPAPQGGAEGVVARAPSGQFPHVNIRGLDGEVSGG